MLGRTAIALVTVMSLGFWGFQTGLSLISRKYMRMPAVTASVASTIPADSGEAEYSHRFLARSASSSPPPERLSLVDLLVGDRFPDYLVDHFSEREQRI